MNKTRFQNFKIPVITPDNYVLGAGNVPRVVLQEDGNWENLLPDSEYQNQRGLETYDCTGFATLNAVEILIFKHYGEKHNYSDRFLGIVAGTGLGGNDPHTVAEAIRKHGLIPEEMLPFGPDITTIDEYYSFKGADEAACRKAGQDWLTKYKFLHEWVFSMNQPWDEKLNNMRTALRYSPLGVAVYAWNQDGRGKYISVSQPNHWACEYAFPDTQRIFDSYEPFKKDVDQQILFCKRYHIEKLAPVEVKKNYVTDILSKILQALKEILQLDAKLIPELIKQPMPPTQHTKEDLITMVKTFIGRDASPKDYANDEFGCAESVSNILNLLFPEFPANTLSTRTLFETLKASKKFRPTLEAKAGCIIVSPRTDVQNGHCGFFVTDTDIVSNESDSGLMLKNYTFQSWVKYFKVKKGLHIYLFEII